jgi:predicted small secreted protein
MAGRHRVMKRIILLVAVGMMLSGCLAHTSTGRDIIKGANTVRILTNGSYHGAGLEERVSNCVKDIFDTNNRGSGCHQ